MRTSAPWLASFLAIAALSGCGQATPAAAPSAPRSPASNAPRPATPAASPAPASAIDPALLERVKAGIARLDAMKTVQGQVIFEEFKDGKSETGRAQVYFRNKPFAGRVEVLQSDRWLASGGVVLWKGGDELKVRPFHMPFSLSFGLDNGQMLSLRGFRMDQTDLFSMAKVLRAPTAQIAPAGARRVHNEDLFLVTVKSPASAPGVDHEVIGLSLAHGFPTYREMYDAHGTLIHRGQGVGLKVDATLDAAKFDI